jgi:hypothetical protein
MKSVKCIVRNDLGLHSRVVQEKSILTRDARRKMPRKDQDTTAETKEGGLWRGPNFFLQKLFVTDA